MDVLDCLERVKRNLSYIRDSPENARDEPASPVIRVAAHAGLLMSEKYLSLTSEESEVYRIAIGTRGIWIPTSY